MFAQLSSAHRPSCLFFGQAQSSMFKNKRVFNLATAAFITISCCCHPINVVTFRSNACCWFLTPPILLFTPPVYLFLLLLLVCFFYFSWLLLFYFLLKIFCFWKNDITRVLSLNQSPHPSLSTNLIYQVSRHCYLGSYNNCRLIFWDAFPFMWDHSIFLLRLSFLNCCAVLISFWMEFEHAGSELQRFLESDYSRPRVNYYCAYIFELSLAFVLVFHPSP